MGSTLRNSCDILTFATPCRKLCSSCMCFQNASCVCSSSWQVWQTIQKLSPERQNSPSFVYILLFLLRMRGKPIALTPRGRGLRFIIIYINVLLAGRRTGLHWTRCTLCCRYIDKFSILLSLRRYATLPPNIHSIFTDYVAGTHWWTSDATLFLSNPRAQIENNRARFFLNL